ncbi:MAG: hypothetical protein BWK76_00765 [Desulfobulbaceae bacterium A2]|nr:MAG: hypothetical protein BWK76_00765 [Desulfobulbaceae bacterium A2]
MNSGALWQMAWALTLVVGIILLLYALARRRFTSLRQGGAIKILEIRYLMPRKAVALVEVRGQQFLLGLGGDRVDLISALPGPDKQPADFPSELEHHRVSSQ